MAARNKPLHPNRVEEMREKIKATLLINRLMNHIDAKPSDENIEDKVMSDSQVRAALGLLKKTLPDLSAVSMATDEDKPFKIAVEWNK